MIYLDYNATTPVDPHVLQRMLPYFTEHFGNPSSGSHAYGWTAAAAVEAAAESLGELIGAAPRELVFTSGATEALNMAIKGAVRGRPQAHVVTVGTEHKAVLDACEAVRRDAGVEVTVLTTDRSGQIDLAALEDCLRESTALVATMWANNETGTVAPIAEIAKVVRSRGIPLLSDATQAVGKISVNIADVDLLACSAHKFYGPKGVGALYIRSGRGGIRLPRLIDGGSQQNGRRGGTLNVPGIVGMGAAAELAQQNLSDEMARMISLRDRLEADLLARCPGAVVNGDVSSRLPQTTSISFANTDATKLMSALRTVAVSAASACQSASGKPSHVLKAMGLSDEEAHATVRFSLGRPTTEQHVAQATDLVVKAWQEVSLATAN